MVNEHSPSRPGASIPSRLKFLLILIFLSYLLCVTTTVGTGLVYRQLSVFAVRYFHPQERSFVCNLLDETFLQCSALSL